MTSNMLWALLLTAAASSPLAADEACISAGTCSNADDSSMLQTRITAAPQGEMDPADIDKDCASFKTESHCGEASCAWNGVSCEEEKEKEKEEQGGSGEDEDDPEEDDVEEEVDTLLQDDGAEDDKEEDEVKELENESDVLTPDGGDEDDDMEKDNVLTATQVSAGSGGDLSCSFDMAPAQQVPPYCGVWLQSKTDDLDFSFPVYDKTPSCGTGPDMAYNANGVRDTGKKYLFMESSGQKSGAKAVLESIPLAVNSGASLDFAYHMRGSHMGSIKVIVKSDGKDQEVWSKSGNRYVESPKNAWHKALVDLSAFADKNVIVQFVAVRGHGYKSDAAIDEVKIGGCSKGPTQATTPPPPRTGTEDFCGFEVRPARDTPYCGLWSDAQAWEKKDQQDWYQPWVHAMHSPGTGPKAPQEGKKFLYIYVAAWRGSKQGDKAILTASNLGVKAGAFLDFWYSMAGSDMASLKVIVTRTGQPDQEVFSKTGEQNDRATWKHAHVDLTRFGGQTISIDIVGIRGRYYMDIAIDSMKLNYGGSQPAQPTTQPPTLPPTTPAQPTQPPATAAPTSPPSTQPPATVAPTHTTQVPTPKTTPAALTGPASTLSPAQAAAVYDRIDSDNSGTINRAELDKGIASGVIGTPGTTVAPALASGLFKRIDTDNSGIIHLDELAKGIASGIVKDAR